MNSFSSRLKRQIFLSIAAAILMAACSAFAIVWLQQQISRSAQQSQKLEVQLAETIRKLRYLDERLATLHQPVVLQGKVSGTLRPSQDDQVVWIRERNVDSGWAHVEVAPYQVSMDLAFIDLNQNTNP